MCVCVCVCVYIYTLYIYIYIYTTCLKISLHFVLACTDMCRLTTGIRPEKCVVRRFRRCANVIECTYRNQVSTFDVCLTVHHRHQ